MKVSLFLCSSLLAASLSAVTVTSFGTADFTVDGGSTTPGFVDSQAADSITLDGSDLGSALWGTFTPVDMSALWANDLVVTGTASTAPASLFTIDLYDSDGDFATFIGGAWTDLSGGGTSTTLTFDSVTLTGGGTFLNTEIFLLTLNTAGGGDNVTANLTGLSQVPEPSTYAALAGLCALGYVMVRRRQ